LIRKLILLILVIVLVHNNFAQVPQLDKQSLPTDSIPATKVPEKDMGDVLHHLFNRHAPLLLDTGLKKDTRKHFSIVPAIGYTLQTGFAGILSGNMAWYTDTAEDTKISSVNTKYYIFAKETNSHSFSDQ
jgi:hypothetical protein